MNFELLTLPFGASELEPVISAETIALHHGKHLATYVNNLNNLLPGSGMEDKPLEDIVANATGGIFNNAGQILNHNLYFEQLKAPSDDNRPVGKIAEAIDEQFGSFDAFKEKFTAAAVTLFGSGWAWLASDSDGTLHILQMPNADNPVTKGLKPLLTFDVWEHAYYVDYRNRRPDHINAMWQILNWEEINRRYKQ
ncbi:MAG: superoxide dismutase [Muribaculaceae bacterium]|nr:superoxide dismutase [Muribaculaceae bacterium]MBR5117450.1 superoxide dismutase [Muribaculaceae bacterium]